MNGLHRVARAIKPPSTERNYVIKNTRGEFVSSFKEVFGARIAYTTYAVEKAQAWTYKQDAEHALSRLPRGWKVVTL